MAPRPRASEARKLVSIAALALAGWALNGACRQSVLLDSAVDAGELGEPGGLAGATGTNDGGAAGDMHGGMTGGGRFDGGRPDGFGVCFGGQIQYIPITMRSPYIIASVDRSADMQMAFSTGATRLEVAQQQVQVLTMKYPIVKWGYEEFPSITGTCAAGQGCCAGDVVPPGYNSGKSIRSAIHACDASGPGCKQAQRPTADALSKCYDAFKMVYNQDEPNDHRYVLLLTSGDPTCMSTPPSMSMPCPDAVAAAMKLSNTFSNTAVFAIGDTAIASACLDMVASYGGLDGHAAKTPNDLAVELDSFVESKAEEACTFDVHAPPADPRSVQLLFDGAPIPTDGNEGWTFDQSSNISLTVHGSFCRSLLQGNVSVHLVAGCMPPHN
jgi:hypothetical protein